MTSTRGFWNGFVGCTARAAQQHSSAWPWNATPPRTCCPIAQDTLLGSGCSGLDTVFPQTSPVMMSTRQIPSTIVQRPMQASRSPVKSAKPPRKVKPRCPSVTASKTRFALAHGHRLSCGRTMSSWCGRRTRRRTVPGGLDQGYVLRTHRGSVWVKVRGSLWKCSQLQSKLAMETQNQLLDDMKAEFQEFPGRRVYTAVEREGAPPEDLNRPTAAPVPPEKRRTWPQLWYHNVAFSIASSVSP